MASRPRHLVFPFVLAAALTAAAIAPAEAVAPELPIRFGGPFELVDHTGAARTDKDFRGRHLLIAFGYTSCPDVCPTTLQTIADALDAIGPLAEAVQPAFVSVDPDRDRSDDLADYVAAFHPRLVGLTGSEAQVRAAAKAYRVHRTKVVAPGTAPDDYLVNHSSLIYLMGPDGKFVTLFTLRTDSESMAATLRKYLAGAAS